MAMTAGGKLGSYEILAPIGAGGMGEVYRARDGKLKRDVALKVLPEVFASDPDRMARFQREAEVLASLNHPNIAHIYGVEEHALVMELVEGESPKGPMAFDNQAYVVYDGRELRACRGGDRRGGAGETPVLGCRSVRDPYEYCGVNRNRLFGKNRRWLTLG